MDAFIHKVKIFFLVVSFVWKRLHWWQIVGLITIFIFFSAVFLDLIIFPLVFNLYLLPKVEKKRGKKIDDVLNSNIGYFPGSYLTKKTAFATYIIDRHQILKKRKEQSLLEGRDLTPLQSIGFNMDEISRAELFFSYWVKYNKKIGWLSMLISIFIVNLHPNFF